MRLITAPGRLATSVIVALVLAIPAAGQLAPVTGPWSKDGNGAAADPLSGANTDSPTVGNGTPSSADDIAIKSPIPQRTLDVPGKAIQLITRVAISGIDGDPTQAWWQLRAGIFNSNGQPGSTGWLGYFTNNSSANRSGDLHEKNNPNTGLYMSLTGATDTFSTSIATGQPQFVDGTYDISLMLTRVAAGLAIDWSYDRVDGGGSFSMHPPTFIDTTPQTYTFNYIGFLVGDFINADQAAFTNVRVTAVPEPATAAVLALLLLVKRRSFRNYQPFRPRNI